LGGDTATLAVPLALLRAPLARLAPRLVKGCLLFRNPVSGHLIHFSRE